MIYLRFVNPAIISSLLFEILFFSLMLMDVIMLTSLAFEQCRTTYLVSVNLAILPSLFLGNFPLLQCVWTL